MGSPLESPIIALCQAPASGADTEEIDTEMDGHLLSLEAASCAPVPVAEVAEHRAEASDESPTTQKGSPSAAEAVVVLEARSHHTDPACFNRN